MRHQHLLVFKDSPVRWPKSGASTHSISAAESVVIFSPSGSCIWLGIFQEFRLGLQRISFFNQIGFAKFPSSGQIKDAKSICRQNRTKEWADVALC